MRTARRIVLGSQQAMSAASAVVSHRISLAKIHLAVRNPPRVDVARAVAIRVKEVVKIVEDIAKQETWIRIVGDRFLADLELGCSKYAVLAHLHLKSIIVRPGTLLLEAGH